MSKKLLVCITILISVASLGFGAEQPLAQRLATTLITSYGRTHFKPEASIFTSPESIEQDLKLLHHSGFDRLIVYGADHSLVEIPRLAHRVGFRLMIMGIWNPWSGKEIQNALRAAPYADLYSKCVRKVVSYSNPDTRRA